jgi:hypothetical protein
MCRYTPLPTIQAELSVPVVAHTHLRWRGGFCLNSVIKLTNFSTFYDTVSDSDYILFDGTMIYEYWNKKDNWDITLDVTYRNEGNKEKP